MLTIMIRKSTTRKKRSKIWTISTEEMSNIVKQSQNLAQVLKHYGYGTTGGTHAILQKRLHQDNIDFSHMKMGIKSNVGRKFNYKMSHSEALITLFTKNSICSPCTIRKYIKMYNFINYECSICKNNGTWNNNTLSLQLDHINGIKHDHTLQNLRWLCPNCHSQTDTYGVKNWNKVK